jgi:dTMP kinase
MPFIALDGGEGFGKSTQLKLLRERLPDFFPERKFIFTREPGGTPFGERIRELILSDYAKDADGKTMFGLFMAARADHVRLVVRPALERGDIVISDRFVAASYAYQVRAQEGSVSESLFTAYLEDLAIFPDLTIIFDMDPEEALERIPQRAEDKNHFDEREIEFHYRLQNAYDDFASTFVHSQYQVAMVDAADTVEHVHAKITQSIIQFLS